MASVPVFLSLDGRLRENWRNAFPKARGYKFDDVLPANSLRMLLLGAMTTAEEAKRLSAGGAFVVLSDRPSEDQALEALACGASGYCNGHAAPQVLRQVATVVANGGVWVGQALMTRLLSSTARLMPPEPSRQAVSLLTERERQVALAVAKGASNKEVARDLAITERTVKAHVGAILEKLGARDRLHLSLIINGVNPRG